MQRKYNVLQYNGRGWH